MKTLSCICLSKSLATLRSNLEVLQATTYKKCAEGMELKWFVAGESGPGFNLSKLHNEALEYATRSDYDWIVIQDADIIFIRPLTLLPETGMGCIKLYFQESTTDWPKEPVDEKRLIPTSTFLLHRCWFHKARYHEGFSYSCFDDMDFHHNVLLANGAKVSETDLTGLHVYHGKRKDDPAIMIRNENLFKLRQQEAKL